MYASKRKSQSRSRRVTQPVIMETEANIFYGFFLAKNGNPALKAFRSYAHVHARRTYDAVQE